MYGKEGKPTEPTPVIPVRVRGPALILKAGDKLLVKYYFYLNL